MNEENKVDTINIVAKIHGQAPKSVFFLDYTICFA